MLNIKQTIYKYRNIFRNASYVAILKIFVMIFPLATYPYIIRTIGSINFGLIVYILAIVSFFRVLVNFGFELSAVKNIAENNENISKKSEIVSSIFFFQLILYVIGLLVFSILVSHIETLNSNIVLSYSAFLLPLCDILLFIWFFQGIEKMKYITITNIAAGFLNFVMIFTFIKEESDYKYVILIQGISMLIGCCISIFLMISKENVRLYKPNKNLIIFYAKDSSPFFISRISVIFNTEVSTVLIANFVGLHAVAYYDLAKKIIEIFKTPNGVLNSVIFPNIAKSKDKFFAKKIFNLNLIIATIFTIVLYFTSESIIYILGGENMAPTLDIINIMGSTVIFTAIIYYSGSALLIAFGYSSIFNFSVIYSTLLYLFLIFFLYFTKNITLKNILFTLIIIDLYIMIYRLYYCKKYKTI